MALGADAYRQALQALLPHGPAWPREEEAALTKLLDGIAQELARVEQRGEDLLEQADPRTAYEMLTAWEEMAGLPDACWILNAADNVAARRMQLVMRLTSLGGQSAAYFKTLAALLGYENVSITEFPPMTCVSDCNAPLNTSAAGWPFVWRLNLPETSISIMDCIGSCTDALREWGDDVLECVIRKARPAHTTVLFAYGA